MLAFGVRSVRGDGDCTEGLVEMVIAWRCLWPLKDGGYTEVATMAGF